MIVGLLHWNRKTTKPGRCVSCKDTIPVGEHHCIVFTVYGKAQQRIRQVRQRSAAAEPHPEDARGEPIGRAIGKREGLHFVRLHMACLSSWVTDYSTNISEWKREHRKGGRPRGASVLAGLSEEERLHRRRLVRRRADLLRRIMREDNQETLVRLYQTLKPIDDQCGKGIVASMIRRRPEAIKHLNRKLEDIRRLIDSD